ncbi:MAG: metallophosphoesterase [Candidatus Pacebacteria bacterium]|nr:metallophosphoesterase [Candidatus Paceibacterota bacterium]
MLFGISFPFWQVTEVFKIYHPLWVITPLILFSAIFALAFGTIFNLHPKFNKALKKIASYWLGGGFILFFVLLALYGINRVYFHFPLTYVVGLGLILSSVLITYAYYHGYKITIHTFGISSHKITKPYTFVQLSDIHIGSNGAADLKRITHILKTLNFDFIVITGDLIDEDYAHFKDLEPLHEINAPMYYITGNHEYYLRHKHFSQFIEKTHIHDINNQKAAFEEIDIYGVDEKSKAKEVLSELDVNEDRFSLGLMHEPHTKEMIHAEKSGIDLMLSGHTHNGQIFPFTLMVRAKYKFIKGLYRLGNMDIHVSQGTSTWGPKMRLGTRNEITLIHLVPNEKTTL